MNQQGYERLIRNHAYWAGRVHELRQRGADALFRCDREDNSPVESCISRAYHEWQGINEEEGPYNPISFEEVWQEMICEGRVCRHCQEARELKAERMVASRRLGAVRAAITRVGRNLAMKEVA